MQTPFEVPHCILEDLPVSRNTRVLRPYIEKLIHVDTQHPIHSNPYNRFNIRRNEVHENTLEYWISDDDEKLETSGGEELGNSNSDDDNNDGQTDRNNKKKYKRRKTSKKKKPSMGGRITHDTQILSFGSQPVKYSFDSNEVVHLKQQMYLSLESRCHSKNSKNKLPNSVTPKDLKQALINMSGFEPSIRPTQFNNLSTHSSPDKVSYIKYLSRIIDNLFFLSLYRQNWNLSYEIFKTLVSTFKSDILQIWPLGVHILLQLNTEQFKQNFISEWKHAYGDTPVPRIRENLFQNLSFLQNPILVKLFCKDITDPQILNTLKKTVSIKRSMQETIFKFLKLLIRTSRNQHPILGAYPEQIYVPGGIIISDNEGETEVETEVEIDSQSRLQAHVLKKLQKEEYIDTSDFSDTSQEELELHETSTSASDSDSDSNSNSASELGSEIQFDSSMTDPRLPNSVESSLIPTRSASDSDSGPDLESKSEPGSESESESEPESKSESESGQELKQETKPGSTVTSNLILKHKATPILIKDSEFNPLSHLRQLHQHTYIKSLKRHSSPVHRHGTRTRTPTYTLSYLWLLVRTGKFNAIQRAIEPLLLIVPTSTDARVGLADVMSRIFQIIADVEELKQLKSNDWEKLEAIKTKISDLSSCWKSWKDQFTSRNKKRRRGIQQFDSYQDIELSLNKLYSWVDESINPDTSKGDTSNMSDTFVTVVEPEEDDEDEEEIRKEMDRLLGYSSILNTQGEDTDEEEEEIVEEEEEEEEEEEDDDDEEVRKEMERLLGYSESLIDNDKDTDHYDDNHHGTGYDALDAENATFYEEFHDANPAVETDSD